MLWTKHEGLSYPSQLLKNRGNAIMNSFLEFLPDEMICM